MWLNDLTILPSLIGSTHFAIFVLPKGYGNSEVSEVLKGKNSLILQPDAEKGSISIEQVRDLRELCRSKQQKHLIVLVESAEKMTESAANAFLKLLEEPNANISFAFITDDAARILITIRSRAQVFRVRPISDAQSTDLLQSLAPKIDAAKSRQILFLASGLPGEIKRLVADKKYFAAMSAKVAAAKTLVQGGSQEKALWLSNFKTEKVAKDTRAKLVEILDLAARFYKMSFAKSKNPAILAKIADLEAARAQILANANYKLALLANVI